MQNERDKPKTDSAWKPAGEIETVNRYRAEDFAKLIRWRRLITLRDGTARLLH